MKQQQEPNSCERPKSNKVSQLLSQDENEQVFALLGRKCQATCTTVAQLYQTEGSAHSVWKKKYTGVLCFIRDSSKKSYFMRMYCLLKNELIWEHEIYDTMGITKSRPYLLTFEGQDGLVALNFVSDDECDTLYRIATTQIENRNRRRQERRNRSKQQLAPAAPTSNMEEDTTKVTLRNHPKISTIQIAPSGNSVMPIKLLNNSKDKKRNRRVTKDDISLPTNFVHVSHVGWNAQKGFDVNGKEDDEMLQQFLSKAGVSEQQLKDRDTRAFIYDFIESNNVLASVKSERVEKPRAPIPPPVPSRQQQIQNGTQRTAPPPPPARQPPPPVPTVIPARGPPPSRPPPISLNNISTTATAPTPAPAPPPPPPPQPQITLAPPPPPMPQQPLMDSESNKAPQSSPNDNRSALMESIRKGTTLKKVDQAALSTGSSDSRSDLMSEIRQGIELRSAQSRELPAGTNRTSSSGGTDALADALRRALQDRGRVIHSSDDDSDESSDNDGEWED